MHFLEPVMSDRPPPKSDKSVICATSLFWPKFVILVGGNFKVVMTTAMKSGLFPERPPLFIPHVKPEIFTTF